MGQENTSRDAALCFCDTANPTPTFRLNRGFRSVTRTAGQPLGCFDLKADVNAGGNWTPGECVVWVAIEALNDDPSPLAAPWCLADYRWRQDADLTWYLQIRCIDMDVGGLENQSFSVKIERINLGIPMALENVDRCIARLSVEGIIGDNLYERFRQSCTWGINPDLRPYFVDVYADPTSGFWHPNECLVGVSTEFHEDDPTLSPTNPLCQINWRWLTTPGGLWFVRLRLAGNGGAGIEGILCGFSLEIRRTR
ncbi:MAG: hypothetical protein E6R03_10125 [Hyphomicrobiaceae bacterium]|nr:MAG: hypothetical protein E6R03_10125 [Hyphomicrobiaceae bacterium]